MRTYDCFEGLSEWLAIVGYADVVGDYATGQVLQAAAMDAAVTALTGAHVELVRPGVRGAG